MKIYARTFSKASLALALASPLALAQTAATGRLVGDPDAVMGPKSAARGVSTTGSYLVHDSLFVNPAAAALDKSYTVTLGYSGMGEQLSASIVDTKSSNLGGGLSYVRRDLRDVSGSPLELGNYKRIEDRAGLSFFGMVSSDLALGVLAKYTYQRSYDTLSENGKNWNGDVGLKYIISRSVQVGLVAQNLLKDESGMNLKAFSLGVETLPMRSVNLSARVIHFAKTPSGAQYRLGDEGRRTGFSLGTEWVVYKGIALRGGYKEQPTWGGKTASIGAGYSDTEWGADYSFQMSTLGDRRNAHTATLYGRF